MVPVDDGERDGRSERLPSADAADDLDAIRLDLHTPAAPVAPLAASEIDVDVFCEQREARRDALDDRRQARPVRLPRGHPPEAHHSQS